MEEIDDLKKIKKEYGEKMMHLCRELFPTILDKPGDLYKLLSSHFAPYKGLYSDIVNEHKEYLFKEYLYSFYDVKQEEVKSYKTVKELLDEAGYELFECKNNEDIQKFRKYYRNDEALCTFRDPHRIDNHHIFFIVKKNVDDIKREDFDDPKREDEYGVSVLDLQFDKGQRQRVSIKSRYNHTVSNPDATYSNNLEQIIPGLTEAFERDYGFNIGNDYKINFELDHYVQARDGKLYKYNYEIDNVHYGPNNVIIDNGKVVDKYLDKAKYMVIDNFILDLENKKLLQYKPYEDELIDSFTDIDIDKISIIKNDEGKFINLILKNGEKAVINIDRNNNIIGYENNSLTSCGDEFLSYSEELKELNLPNLKECGNEFLPDNHELKELNLPNLKECGSDFLFRNKELKELNLPNLEKCGHGFLSLNRKLHELNLPNLKECGDDFLYSNNELKELNLPNLKECGIGFLYYNEGLKELNLPNLKECWTNFLFSNNELKELNLPNLKECGNDFLCCNHELHELNLPNLEKCGHSFLNSNKDIQELSLPMLQECGNGFLSNNKKLKELILPNLEKCGSNFLVTNNILEKVELPKLSRCYDGFLWNNYNLRDIILPRIEYCGDDFLRDNHSIKYANLPKLRECGNNFMAGNHDLTMLELPELEMCGRGFLRENELMNELYIPKLQQDMFVSFMPNNKNWESFLRGREQDDKPKSR